jgi:uncharacterized protein YutE (UPF0331/DUF86 family)
MPKFDQDIMLKLVSELRKSVRRLNNLSAMKKEELFGDPDKVASVKYHFIVAIESCIDMCNHIISQNGFRVPEDYADTFRVMGEEGALEKEKIDDLVAMAKFRNRLVHLYWEVNNDQLHQILLTRLDDFDSIRKSISSYLNWGELNTHRNNN